MEQEIGNGWAEGVHPDDFDKCLKIYLDTFQKREVFEMDAVSAGMTAGIDGYSTGECRLKAPMGRVAGY